MVNKIQKLGSVKFETALTLAQGCVLTADVINDDTICIKIDGPNVASGVSMDVETFAAIIFNERLREWVSRKTGKVLAAPATLSMDKLVQEIDRQNNAQRKAGLR